MSEEPPTVALTLEYPAEVERLFAVVWAAMLAAEGEGDAEGYRRLSPIHDRLVRILHPHD